MFAEGYTGFGFHTWMVASHFRDSGSVSWQDIREIWDDPEHADSEWFSVCCWFPNREAETTVKTIGELNAAGYEPWDTYIWDINEKYPNTDVSITCGSYGERVMIFAYGGKWVGMHSLIGCDTNESW